MLNLVFPFQLVTMQRLIGCSHNLGIWGQIKIPFHSHDTKLLRVKISFDVFVKWFGSSVETSAAHRSTTSSFRFVFPLTAHRSSHTSRQSDWRDVLNQTYSVLSCVFHRVGHNEIIGVMRVGSHAEGLGRDHWNEMLAYPRKPIAHWHPLLEPKKSEKEVRLGAEELSGCSAVILCFRKLNYRCEATVRANRLTCGPMQYAASVQRSCAERWDVKNLKCFWVVQIITDDKTFCFYLLNMGDF